MNEPMVTPGCSRGKAHSSTQDRRTLGSSRAHELFRSKSFDGRVDQSRDRPNRCIFDTFVGLRQTHESQSSGCVNSPGRVVLERVMEHTSLADGSMPVGVANALIKMFPEAKAFYLRQMQREGQSATGTLLNALTRVTRLSLTQALGHLCGNPAGVVDARRLNDEQERSMLELMNMRQMDRSMLMLKKAGVLMPSVEVIRHEGNHSDGTAHTFDLVLYDTHAARLRELLSVEAFQAAFFNACRDTLELRNGKPFGIDALLVFCSIDTSGSIRGDNTIGSHQALFYLSVDGVEGTIRLNMIRCEPLMTALASDAGLTAWLTRGYFQLFTPYKSGSFCELERLPNFSFSDVCDERHFLEGLKYVPHSRMSGSGFYWPDSSFNNLDGVKAYGAEIEVRLCHGWPDKQTMVERLTTSGVVGLREEHCVELPPSHAGWRKVRLNDELVAEGGSVRRADAERPNLC